MSVLTATLRLDVRLQARSRLYAIGVFVAVLSGIVARVLFEPAQAGNVLAVLYLLGVGGTTYIFGASLVLMDKSQGTLLALGTSPLTSTAYMLSKAITLTTFATIESAIIYLVGFFGTPLDFAPMILGVVFLGLFYSFISMGQVARHDSVFSFLIPGAIVVGSVAQLPAMYVLEVGPPELWHLIPTQGPLLLMLAGDTSLAAWQWAYAIGMSLLSVALAAVWARQRFRRFITLSEG